jgi:transcriptional regulator
MIQWVETPFLSEPMERPLYVPEPFRVPEKETAWTLIEEIRLGCLVTNTMGLAATHIPFLVDRARGPGGVLVGHMARANNQWRALVDGGEVLVVFTGPNTYVSPGWYGVAPRAPTWNFVVVQVHGYARLIEDATRLRDIVLTLSDTMEVAGSPWKAAELDGAYIDRLLPGIVGFEIELSRLEAQIRLSQQNDKEVRQRVLATLEQGSLRERAVADMMKRLTPL